MQIGHTSITKTHVITKTHFKYLFPIVPGNPVDNSRFFVNADNTNSTAVKPTFPPTSSSFVGSLQSVEQALAKTCAEQGKPRAASNVVKLSLSVTFISTLPKKYGNTNKGRKLHKRLHQE